MEITYSEEKEISGEVIYSLFDKVGWVLPKSKKPQKHEKIDGISNHTIYLDHQGDLEILSNAFANSHSIFVARNGEEIIGFVRVISDNFQRSFIYDLIVDLEYHKNGIGKHLVEMCIKKYAHTQITLGTASATMKFYEKFGFVKSENYMELATESY